jgi:hypothetical protein
MAYFPQSVVLKTEEACGGDGDICVNKETDNDDSGSGAARRTEQVYVHGFLILVLLFLSAATV